MKRQREELVTLSVRGARFQARLSALRDNFPDSFFGRFFGKEYIQDSKEEDVFVDRPSDMFHVVLNYVCGDATLHALLAELTRGQCARLRAEADYYQLDGLTDALQRAQDPPWKWLDSTSLDEYVYPEGREIGCSGARYGWSIGNTRWTHGTHKWALEVTHPGKFVMGIVRSDTFKYALSDTNNMIGVRFATGTFLYNNTVCEGFDIVHFSAGDVIYVVLDLDDGWLRISWGDVMFHTDQVPLGHVWSPYVVFETKGSLVLCETDF